MTVNISKPSINIREKLAELDKPSGIAGEAVLRADSVQEIRNQIGAGRKNLIINGDMRISQRGSWTSATSAVNGNHTLDRWEVHFGSVTATAQDTGKKLKIVATATNSSAYLIPQQQVEFHTDYAGRTVTASAKITSNNTNARLVINDGVSNFSSTAHSGNGEEELLSVTATLSTSPTTLKVRPIIATAISSSVSITSGDYIEFGDVQLELGSVATDFEHRSYGEELALCQRYCYVIAPTTTNKLMLWGTGNGTSNTVTTHRHPVQMRGEPALTYSALADFIIYDFGDATSLGSVTGITLVTSISTDQWAYLQLTASSAITGVGKMVRSVGTSAKLTFDAEL